MLFNSIQFLIFFPIITILYFTLPKKIRWFLLLVSSSIFYMAFVPKYILILGVTIVIDFFAGIFIDKMRGNRKRIFLIVSILTNVGILFVFKYFNFFNENITRLASILQWDYPISSLSILLPIGLSFHTFQSMSYIIEVYRGKQKPEKHFGIYALYVMYYPQLVAGPIERPQNMLWQFHKEHKFDINRIADGLKLMVWGFFKKLVIADNMALVVNAGYKFPNDLSGLSLLIATYFFAIQIYCDFSGYTDIARGASRIMGIELMENFKRPYLSKSISEFWRNWHISLTGWFKDYVYIPLGGNRCGKWKWCRNILIIFLLSGLWHGANWTYITWGALNGLYLVIAILTKTIRLKVSHTCRIERVPVINKSIKILITLNLICFTWIFFRADSISSALSIIKKIFTDFTLNLNFNAVGISTYQIVLNCCVILFLIIVEILQYSQPISERLYKKPLIFRWGIYYIVLFLIIILGVYDVVDKSPFIYFQF